MFSCGSGRWRGYPSTLPAAFVYGSKKAALGSVFGLIGAARLFGGFWNIQDFLEHATHFLNCCNSAEGRLATSRRRNMRRDTLWNPCRGQARGIRYQRARWRRGRAGCR